MKRVMDNEFKIEHQVTIGVEFGSYGLEINDKVIKLQIWDTVSNSRRILFCLPGARCLGGTRVFQISDKNILPRGALRVFNL